MDKPIYFYEPDDNHGFLANFFPCSIAIAGIAWPSSEHYYQAQKFKDPALQKKIHAAACCADAFALSRHYQQWQRHDWCHIRVDIMTFIVREKFFQNPALARQLIATGTRELFEHSHRDAFWGDGGDGTGQNQLGKILMTLREELQQRSDYQPKAASMNDARH